MFFDFWLQYENNIYINAIYKRDRLQYFTFCFSNYLKNGQEQNILKSHYDFVTNQLVEGPFFNYDESHEKHKQNLEIR